MSLMNFRQLSSTTLLQANTNTNTNINNVDNLFAKKLQTIPLILNMYIWNIFTQHSFRQRIVDIMGFEKKDAKHVHVHIIVKELHIFSCLHILSISSQKFSSASSLSSPSFARRLLLHSINITVIQTMKTQFLFFFNSNFICQYHRHLNADISSSLKPNC